MILALELTDVSWIISDRQGNKIGILSKTLKGYNLLTIDGISKFANKIELETMLGKISWKDRIVVENIEIKIVGFPVLNLDIFDLDENPAMPSFKKNKNSKTRYAAGYWGLKFSNHYVGSFCPKVSTLLENKNLGPYKNKFSMNTEISLENKRLNNGNE